MVYPAVARVFSCSDLCNAILRSGLLCELCFRDDQPADG